MLERLTSQRGLIPHFSRVDLRPRLRQNFAGTVVVHQDGSVDVPPLSSECPIFQLTGGTLVRGWYMAEVQVDSAHSFMDGGFELACPNTGRVRTLRLPLRSGRVAKRLIWLPRGEEQLRFFPMRCGGEATIRKLTLVRVSLPFARNRMRARLSRRFLPVPSRLVNRWVSYDMTFHPNGARVSYGEWIRRIEPSLWPKIPASKNLAPISVVVPVMEADCPGRISRTLKSIVNQAGADISLGSVHLFLYGSWDDAQAAAIEALAGEFVSVSAHRVCEGFLASHVLPEDTAILVCPPEGILPSRALGCFAAILQQAPATGLVYTDEDVISPAGLRSAPRFKPGWNPDLLFSNCYLGNLLLITPLIRYEMDAVDFCNPAWNLELILRVMKLHENRECNIVHIPRVMYHRFLECVSATEWKQLECERQVLQAHFIEHGQPDVSVEMKPDTGQQHVRWPIGECEPLVSLLIPTRDNLPVLKLCIESIFEKTRYQKFEILVLDNQSEKPETLAYLAEIAERPNVRVLRYDAPFNYSAINNFGVRHAHGSIIGLVNNDIEVITPDWLTEMVGHVQREAIGCVGAKLFYGDGRIQHAGVVVGLGGLAGHVHKFLPADAPGYMNRLQATQAFSAVTAACLLVRKAVFESVGGLNEQHLQVAFNDVDFCLKVGRAGYRNLWTPWAQLYHHESVSRGIDNTPQKKARFERESKFLRSAWPEYLSNPGQDPHYSPFLTHVGENFSLGLNEKRDIPLFR